MMTLAYEVASENKGQLVSQPADLRIFVAELFFIFGGTTRRNDRIVPKFKKLFKLDYFRALLVQPALLTPIMPYGVEPRTRPRRRRA